MINKYFYNISIAIIGVLFSIFLLTSLGFIFHVGVTPLYVLISVILGLFYLRRNSDTYNDFLKQILIVTLITFFSYFVSLFFLDATTDGRSYHTSSMILLKNGWNPIYDNIREITLRNNMFPFNSQWGDWYVKFCEIIGANIYKVTGYIDSTKTTNWLMFFTVFMYVFAVLNNFAPKKPLLKFLAAFITVINPVCICQLLNNYIDINMYYAFVMLIFTIINIEKKNLFSKTDAALIVISSVILSNCKLTGSFYLAITLICWFIYRLINKTGIKKVVITGLLSFILVCATGINPYYTNFKRFGNMFHPIMGKYKLAVAEINFPQGFRQKSRLERFFLGHFAESGNSIELWETTQKPVHLKIPFTIIEYADLFTVSDMRTGGFGYFWGGILILTLLALPFIRFRNREDKKIFFLLLSIILLTTALNPHNWWARYVPQLWLLPVFTFMFYNLNEEDSKNKKPVSYKTILTAVMLFVVIYNCTIISIQNISHYFMYQLKIRNFLDKFEQTAKPNGIYFMQIDVSTYFTDETVKPHLMERNIKMIQVPSDISKIESKEFKTLQPHYSKYNQYYFYKNI